MKFKKKKKLISLFKFKENKGNENKFFKIQNFFSSTFLPLSRQPNTSPHCAR